MTTLCSAPEIDPYAPRAMNRQVGPSIVLSVLIVCFFAVALFQHDPPRSAHSKTGPVANDSRTRADAQSTRRSPSRTSSGLSESLDPAKTALTRREIHSRPISWTTDSPVVPAPTVTAESSRRTGANSAGPVSPRKEERVVVPRQPGSGFTVVDANETLEDVARRIYGSEGLAESLWRANRDVLSRSDSPLATGMVLRTPVVR
jgi:hypothetical protein